jgi:hypothetical protein
MIWAGHVARIGKRRVPYKAYIEEYDGETLLRRPRPRRANNIKTELQMWDRRNGLG